MRSYLYLPYTIDIFNSDTVLSPPDDELFIIYVLYGAVALSGPSGQVLHEMDIYTDSALANPLQLTINGAAAVIRIDYAFVASCNDFRLFSIHLDSSDHTGNNYARLNQRLLHITNDYFSEPLPSQTLLYNNAKQLLEDIISHFPCTDAQQPERTSRMKYLLYHCYTRSLTLDELSAELGISPSIRPSISNNSFISH